MKHQGLFANLAIVGGIGVFASYIYRLVFVLMPSYDLAAPASLIEEQAGQEEALARLDQLQARGDTAQFIGLIFAIMLVAGLTMIVIGKFSDYAQRVQK